MTGRGTTSSVRMVMVIVGVAVLSSLTSGATFEDYRSLASALFSNYSKELRPVSDSNQVVGVYMSMWLSSIQELDEINQQLTFSALFDVHWEDSNLSWNSSDYNQTSYFTYPQKNLWIPDITISNSVESMTELGFDRNYMTIYSTGNVNWIVGGVFRTSCDIDVTYYPFDTQECHVVITTLVSTIHDIDVSISKKDSVRMEWYSRSGSWDLLNFTVGTVSDTSDRTLIAFTMTMRRLRTYYVVTIIIPVLFLSLTSTLVFALPADSGEKMGTSITVLLAFAVYLSIVSEQMPRTSTRVSILAVFLTLLLGQTATGVLLSVWILNLHFRDDADPPGRCLRRMAVFLRAVMCKGPRKATVTPADKAPKALFAEKGDNGSCGKDIVSVSGVEQEMLTWKMVAYIMDRFLFRAFSLLLFLTTVVFMTVLAVGN